MNRILKGLLATTLVASFAVAPVSAAPMFAPQAPEQSSNVETVQFGPGWNRMERRINRMERRDFRRAMRNLDRRGDAYYYNGHRGYRYARPGYRQIDGWWFPGAAFVAGAIIGGAIADAPRRAYRYSGGSAHQNWCANRYQSYHAWDNTFQPYNGPRRLCYSPYS